MAKNRDRRGAAAIVVAAAALALWTAPAFAATQLSLYPRHPFTVRVAPSYIPLAVGVPVPNGTIPVLAVMTQQSLYVTLRPGQAYYEKVVPDAGLKAPISQGQVVGRLEAVLTTDGRVLASAPVIAANNDPPGSPLLLVWRSLFGALGGVVVSGLRAVGKLL